MAWARTHPMHCDHREKLLQRYSGRCRRHVSKDNKEKYMKTNFSDFHPTEFSFAQDPVLILEHFWSAEERKMFREAIMRIGLFIIDNVSCNTTSVFRIVAKSVIWANLLGFTDNLPLQIIPQHKNSADIWG